MSEQIPTMYRGHLILDTNKKGDNRFELYEPTPTAGGTRAWQQFDTAPDIITAHTHIDMYLA